MGVVGHTLFHGPLLHGMGNHGSQVGVQAAAVVDGLLQSLVGLLGQALLHHSIVKHIAAK